MIGFLSKILFLEGILFIILFFYSLIKRENRLAIIFSIMCLSISVYVIDYGFELNSNSLEQIKFFLKTEYFGLTFMTAFGMMFSYKFHFSKSPSLKLKIFIFFIPIITLFLCSTNEYHNLFYANVSAVQYEKNIIADIRSGPWYIVNIIYSYAVLLFGTGVFFNSWRHSKYKLKTQAFWLFFGSIWPGIANILYLSELSPWPIDFTPFGFGMLAISYLIAIFCYDFLEIKEMISSFTFSHISEGIIVIDDKNRLIDFNNAAQKIFDCLDIKYVGLDFSCLLDYKKTVNKDKNRFEVEVIRNDKKEYYEFRTASLKDNKKILGYVYFIQDVTRQKEMIKELNNMANYDELTQIYNRRRLMEEAERELTKAKRDKRNLSLLMIDIDHFKKVNDKYGHLAGDEVIKMVARACENKMRINDIIGRYGGEEFIIILPNADKESAINIAESIREHIQGFTTNFKKEKINVTVSIGVACAIIKDNSIDIEQMIHEADTNLYYAKNHGRNQIHACEL